MLYVFEGGSVVYDGSSISDKEKARAVEVENLPKKETPSGRRAILKADKRTEKVWYEYEENDEVTKLQNLLDDALDLLVEMEVF